MTNTTSRSQLQLLLVEDNPVNQKLAYKVLHLYGVEPVIIDNGEDAVELCLHGSVRYNLILMDLQLPKMSGLDACRLIKQSVAAGEIPDVAIIAMSAQPPSDCDCFDGILNKPFTLEQVGKLLQSFMDSSSAAAMPKVNSMPESHHQRFAMLVENRFDGDALMQLQELEQMGNPGFVVMMMQQFLQNSAQKMALLQQNCSSGDDTGIYKAAHSLKSASASVGAKKLAKYCADLEQQPQTGAQLLAAIEQEYQRVIAMLQDFMQQQPAA